ncbi:MAG: DMT family transporter [Rhodocyclaceae bacterium]
MRRPLSHWLLLFALVAMWGSSFLMTKVAVSSLAPTHVVSGRLLVAALLLCTVVLVARRAMPCGGRIWAYFVVMAVVGNALPFILISWGQQRIDSGLAGILMAVMPLTTLVLAHFFVPGEHLDRRRLAGFGLGFCGIVVLIGPQALARLGGSGEVLAAQVAVLGGAVCYAVNTIVARRRPEADALLTAAVVLALATGLSLPLALATPLPVLAHLPLEAALAVGFLGVVCTALATVGYFRLIALAGPTFLSLINYLIPLWAVGLGMLFLGERPEWNALFALVMILAGIGLSQSRR